MKNTHLFDVLVVYTQGIATSASSTRITSTLPFLAGSSRASYNDAYAYFLTICAQYKLRAAFTTTSEIIGAGLCKSYWLYEKNTWIKVKNPCFTPLIFDKFSPINQKRINDRSLLFSATDIKPFNDEYLLNLFYDKYLSYEKLTHFSIPTVILQKANHTSIHQAIRELHRLMKTHRYVKDFSSDIILKDRHGSGGSHIYKITPSNIKNIVSIMKKNKTISFIIQPFIQFDKGYTYQNKQCLADIRLIYMKEKIMQTYVRMAKPKDFRCNIHQGGGISYIKTREIPQAVLKYAQEILKTLDTKTSLFALDFVISNNGNVFFMEGNIGPGINWSLSSKEDEQKAKQLSRIIVRELAKRTSISTIKKQEIFPTVLPAIIYHRRAHQVPLGAT